MLCVWCGVAFVLLFGAGFVGFSGFVPPTRPLLSPSELVAFYQSNVQGIRFGQVLMMTSAALLVPFSAVIAGQMRRIPGSSPVLADTQLAAGAVNVILLIFSPLLWSAAAFRPERDPALIQLLHDIGWIAFIIPFALLSIQAAAIAVAVLMDGSERPVFPRWLGYVNAWVALAYVPAGLATFFKTGPFAWNGLLTFWLAFAAFFGWFASMIPALLRAIREQHAADQPSPPPEPT